MTIDEQVEAAWEEYVNDMDEGVRNSVAFHSDVFDAGYRAALRGLWRVVDKSEVQECVHYSMLINGEWQTAWYIGDDVARNRAESATRIVKFTGVPSPAEVFGEEVSK